MILNVMKILEKPIEAEAQATKTKEGTTEEVVVVHRTTDVMTCWNETLVVIYLTSKNSVIGDILAIGVRIGN